MSNLISEQDLTKRSEHEIELADVFVALWRGRAVVVGCIIIAVLCAITYLNLATYRYTAELTVTPANSSANDMAAGSGLGQLGNVAALAGFNIPNAETISPFQLYVEGLLLRETAERLSTNQEMMKVIFVSELDESTGLWQEPERGILGRLTNSFYSLFGIPVYDWQPPNGARLHDYIKESVVATQSPGSAIVTISFKHVDPNFAVNFLTALDQTVDMSLRQRSLSRSSLYITYLSELLVTVRVAEHREAITAVLSEQERVRMMANSAAPFAAEVFDRPAASLVPTNPVPFIILVVSVLAGTTMGVVIVASIGVGRNGSNSSFLRSPGATLFHTLKSVMQRFSNWVRFRR